MSHPTIDTALGSAHCGDHTGVCVMQRHTLLLLLHRETRDDVARAAESGELAWRSGAGRRVRECGVCVSECVCVVCTGAEREEGALLGNSSFLRPPQPIQQPQCTRSVLMIIETHI